MKRKVPGWEGGGRNFLGETTKTVTTTTTTRKSSSYQGASWGKVDSKHEAELRQKGFTFVSTEIKSISGEDSDVST